MALGSVLMNLIESSSELIVPKVFVVYTMLGVNCGTKESATLAEHLPLVFPEVMIPLG